MIYRERRERKLARLREWAEKRDRKAQEARRRVHDIADQIPFGQPILVGHHSERRARRDQERIEDGMQATVEHTRKAEAFRERAENIESALASSIYSDDPDAIEQLQARIADLEARQARMKEINAAIRRGVLLDALNLTDREQRDLEIAARFNGVKGYPAYALGNNSANIRRNRERLQRLLGGAR